MTGKERRMKNSALEATESTECSSLGEEVKFEFLMLRFSVHQALDVRTCSSWYCDQLSSCATVHLRGHEDRSTRNTEQVKRDRSKNTLHLFHFDIIISSSIPYCDP